MALTPRRGGDATTEISHDGTTWTDISDAVYGLDGLDIAEQEGTTEVGGGGIRMGSALTGYVTSGESFTVDENSRSRPLLVGYNAKTLHVRYRSQGAGSGNPQALMSGPCTVSHEFGERDKRRFTVSVTNNGAINRAAQP